MSHWQTDPEGMASLMELRRFDNELTVSVASWATSAQEVGLLTGRDIFPFPAESKASWRRTADDIEAYLLYQDQVPVGYGELWLDEEEDEVELARIIVAPAFRGRGFGAQLVRSLLVPALAVGYASVFLRVRPENERAIRTYRRVGFEPVADALAAEWNVPQPVKYAWFRYPTDTSAGDAE